MTYAQTMVPRTHVVLRSGGAHGIGPWLTPRSKASLVRSPGPHLSRQRVVDHRLHLSRCLGGRGRATASRRRHGPEQTVDPRQQGVVDHSADMSVMCGRGHGPRLSLRGNAATSLRSHAAASRRRPVETANALAAYCCVKVTVRVVSARGVVGCRSAGRVGVLGCGGAV